MTQIISIPVWKEDFEESRVIDGAMYQPYPIGMGKENARLLFKQRFGIEPAEIFERYYTLWAGPVGYTLSGPKGDE